MKVILGIVSIVVVMFIAPAVWYYNGLGADWWRAYLMFLGVIAFAVLFSLFLYWCFS